MAEKVIHEVRFIETDDGFRIEVKGDKERLKEMGFGPGMMGFGHGMGFGPRMFFQRHRHGRHGRRRRFGPGFGPWAWWNQWFEEDDEEANEEKPTKDA